MKKFVCAWILILGFFLPYYAPAGIGFEGKIPEKYKKWLEEEVVYIMTPKEKEVFLQLETDKERDLFVEAFWKQRDPTPGTPKNEFKEEHYRRIEYAENWFGRGTSLPGWKTDRGKIYIILGPPVSVESHGEDNSVVPLKVWFYQRDSRYGLPPNFYIVFFQEGGVGDYEIYSPVRHGPKRLLESYFGDAGQAYNILKRINPELARISYSLIPGETVEINPRPSISSESLLGKIELLAQKQIEDQYAEKLLKYKDFVEVDYSINYIGNDSLVKIFRDQAGFYMVHYAIEPEKLSLMAYEDEYSINLEFFGKISDAGNRTVYQFEKNVPLIFSQEQLKSLQAKRFSLQDVFPMIPGDYRFDLLIKNTISKEFTSIESTLSLPEPAAAPQMSSLVLAHRARTLDSEKSSRRPFQFGNLQLYPPAQKSFALNDTLYVYFQISGLSSQLRNSGIIVYSIFKENEKVQTEEIPIREAGKETGFLQPFSLESFQPGLYSVQVSVLDEKREKILTGKEEYLISHAAFIPRAWSLSEIVPSSEDPVYAYILGNQLLNREQTAEAKDLLERAYRKRPDSLRFALGYTKALFIRKEYPEIKDILAPFLDKADDEEGIYFYLGKSSHILGRYDEAISYYEKYLTHFGTHLGILNSIGDCFYKSGETERALRSWKKSLEIDPEQKDIQKIVDSLEK